MYQNKRQESDRENEKNKTRRTTGILTHPVCDSVPETECLSVNLPLDLLSYFFPSFSIYLSLFIDILLHSSKTGPVLLLSSSSSSSCMWMILDRIWRSSPVFICQNLRHSLQHFFKTLCLHAVSSFASVFHTNSSSDFLPPIINWSTRCISCGRRRKWHRPHETPRKNKKHDKTVTKKGRKECHTSFINKLTLVQNWFLSLHHLHQRCNRIQEQQQEEQRAREQQTQERNLRII